MSSRIDKNAKSSKIKNKKQNKQQKQKKLPNKKKIPLHNYNKNKLCMIKITEVIK
jgi:hypothetical protein